MGWFLLLRVLEMVLSSLSVFTLVSDLGPPTHLPMAAITTSKCGTECQRKICANFGKTHPSRSFPLVERAIAFPFQLYVWDKVKASNPKKTTHPTMTAPAVLDIDIFRQTSKVGSPRCPIKSFSV